MKVVFMSLIILFNPQSINKETGEKRMPKIIEVVQFKTKKGISEKELMAAALAIEPVLEKLKGFIKRSFAKSQDDEWLDMVYWIDLESAEHPAEEVQKNDKCLAFFALIDEKTMRFKHYQVL